MPNLVDVSYTQTGQNIATGHVGMREMQARAFEYRNAQYLFLKAPPASGKSRALMFLALDKLFNQDGKRHTPREWFIVPLHVIEIAVQLLICGEILDYRYDSQGQKIVGK